MTIRVLVTSAAPNNWYNRHIGHVFEVARITRVGPYDFYIIDDDPYLPVGINFDNAVDVDELLAAIDASGDRELKRKMREFLGEE